jgi:hypothetical protein
MSTVELKLTLTDQLAQEASVSGLLTLRAIVLAGFLDYRSHGKDRR